jgi:pimeloyl-ACP methyl ester carboxylesterase
MAEVKTGYAEVNGIQMYYEEAGDGHPLVLIHADIADHRMWSQQFSEFAKHYRTIAYDRRGFGQSQMGEGEFSDRTDLYGLLQYLNVDKVYLIGCSMGGSTTFDFTLEHPEMVDALIPVSAVPIGFNFVGEMPTPKEKEMIAAFQENDTAGALELAAQLWVDGEGSAPGRADAGVRNLVKEMFANSLGTMEQRDANWPVAWLEPTAAGRLGEIQAPLLFIYGELDDPNFIAAADQVVREAPHAQKVAFADAAHMLNMEQPEKFNQLVLDFLNSYRLAQEVVYFGRWA